MNSIYRLVLIFVNDWFPYYAHWEPKGKSTDRAQEEVRALGFRIWSIPGAVTRDEETGDYIVIASP